MLIKSILQFCKKRVLNFLQTFGFVHINELKTLKKELDKFKQLLRVFSLYIIFINRCNHISGLDRKFYIEKDINKDIVRFLISPKKEFFDLEIGYDIYIPDNLMVFEEFKKLYLSFMKLLN